MINGVSVCVREWIETHRYSRRLYGEAVSLCVREWIETAFPLKYTYQIFVSLCVWVLIETCAAIRLINSSICLPLREGVD